MFIDSIHHTTVISCTIVLVNVLLVMWHNNSLDILMIPPCFAILHIDVIIDRVSITTSFT